MIHKIVIPVRGDGEGDNVLAHAAAVARYHSAHIVVTHCRARPQDMMPYGVPIPASMKKMIMDQSAELANQLEAGLRKELEDLAQILNLKLTDGPSQGPSVSWVEEQGRQVEVIRHYGRLADLICVAKPDVDRNLGTNTLKAALFHTGRPVMMCPHAKVRPEILCENITIGWNGSTEAARAVALTMDIIAKAKSVTVLAGGTEPYGASAEDLLDYLAVRGVKASIKRLPAKKKAGRELLEESQACGADTLIMGAYGDSHERETIFGGNTQYVVDHSTMPVILVH